jgi:abortive infection bacteriophage resistance protein
MASFSKPAKTTEEHYQSLIERGLEIEDKERFFRYLSHISYYRLTGYIYPFQTADGAHTFKEKTSFDKILNHYLFDKKLRILILDYVERIEISIRTNICNVFALEYGSHWYLNSELFNNSTLHSSMVEKIKKYCKDTNEIFIRQYYHKYDAPGCPPIWMIIESLTFGDLASIFENLKDNDQKKQIAGIYKCVVPYFESWLKSINFIRNCCAHHSRLWNRKIPLKPMIPSRKKNRFLDNIDSETDKRLYGILSCMLYVLNSISPKSKFKERLKSLFAEYPDVNIAYMGFVDDWEKEGIWS